MEMKFYMEKKILKIRTYTKKNNRFVMSEQIRIILIIIVSVSIFGLIVFILVKNYIRSKINYYLNEKKNSNKLK